MIKYYDINGEIVDAKGATIPINDLGLLRGYGIFDYFLFEEFYPFFFNDYLDRFYRTANMLDLEVPIGKEELKKRVLRLIEANEQEEGGMRVLLTGGTALDSYTSSVPSMAILQYPMPRYANEIYENGAKLLSFNHQRSIPEAKTTNYLASISIQKKLKAQGALDVLYHNNGWLRESSRANVFFLDSNRQLITPDSEVLGGITRKHLIQLAKEKLAVEVRPVHLDELETFEEVYLTSSIRDIMPISQIDDIRYAAGKNGPFFQELRSMFLAYRKAEHAQRN